MELCVPKDLGALIMQPHTTTSRRTNIFSLYGRIAGTEIPVRRIETAVIGPQYTILEPNVWNAPLLFLTHTFWARFPSLNFTEDIPENQNAAQK